ncbi:hypothetical protein ACT4ML_05750 [Natrinema sp. LN54]|uniref:hypothetical protein n=1 Tax=Natrinema sp. LN54 TaxID=3458705 RepID=UPI0040375DA1
MSDPTRRAILTGGTVVLISGSVLSPVVAQDDSERTNGEDGDDGFDPDYEFEGTGQGVTDEIELNDGVTIGQFEYSGGASMTVSAIPQSDDDYERPIVMTDEGEAGVGGILASEGSYLFEIEPLFVDIDLDESDIEWRLAITQPEVNDEDDVATPPLETDGDGSTVLGPIECEGTETAAVTHDGEGSFAVDILPSEADYPDSLFFESGEFEGETTVSTEGTGWITVQATDTWTLEIE